MLDKMNTWRALFNLIIIHLLIGVQMGISQEDIFWENEDGSLLETSVMVDSGDMSKNMLKRIHQYFDKRIESSREERARYWEVDFSDLTRLEKSVEKNRKELSRILGIVDSVVPEVN